MLYVGRIDENKGCRELFQFFQQLPFTRSARLQLVLIGKAMLPIPDHPLVRHLGFISDQDKFDAMAAARGADHAVYYESLSMVALEAWALGKSGAGQRALRRAAAASASAATPGSTTTTSRSSPRRCTC